MCAKVVAKLLNGYCSRVAQVARLLKQLDHRYVATTFEFARHTPNVRYEVVYLHAS